MELVCIHYFANIPEISILCPFNDTNIEKRIFSGYMLRKIIEIVNFLTHLGLLLPGNDFLSKTGEGSVDVLDSGP